MAHCATEQAGKAKLESRQSSDLEQAIKNGEPFKEITRLLDSGAPSTGWSSSGALFTAVNEDRDDVVSLLLNRGADINILGGDYGTPLAAAAHRGLKTMVTLLLDRGASINMVGGRYGTALAAAAFMGKIGILSLLLDQGADINMVGGDYGTPLAAAAFRGFAKTILLLLDRGADINLVGGKYGTALAAAAFKAWGPEMALLLDHGADINAVGGEFGTALTTAAFARRTSTMLQLLDWGASINIVGGQYGTALAAAVYENFEGAVGLLLDRGADINMVGGEYGTALVVAAFRGLNRMVSLLLDWGAVVNMVYGKYGTALAAAALNGFDSIVELLLDRGADINMVAGRYGTALAAAAFIGFDRTASLLLDRGADVNMVCGKYGTALTVAAIEGRVKTVSLLLDRGADINAVSGEYGTALAMAAFKGFEPVVELLLDRGASINVVCGKSGTALSAAAKGRRVKTLSLLLDRGADIHILGGQYGTALAAAAFGGTIGIVRLLLDCGANIEVVSSKYETVLTTAALKGDPEIVELLLDRGADINAVGGRYGTALTGVAYEGIYTITSLLLDRGANINAVAGEYGTALAAAAVTGRVDIVRMLLDQGADINVVGGKYGTALAAAACEGRIGTLQMLLDYGADINVGGGEYGTALAAAAPRGLPNTVSLLLDRGADIYAVGGSYSRFLFPMPYTGNHNYTPSSLSSFDTLLTGFREGESIASEQADIPCQKLNEKVLRHSLAALVGLNKTIIQSKDQWFQNDVTYFVTHHFDFGQAYAAARVAWRGLTQDSMESRDILTQRSRWHQHAHMLDKSRSEAIERDYSNSKQELINLPYSIMPRRLWDLKSNRLIDFRMLHAAQRTIKTPPTFWAVTHSWTSDMSTELTAINQYQWPVPLPKGISLDYLRSEFLNLGAEYVWLDVICLRQKSDIDSLEQLRQQEWKLDVPTIGNIYRAAAKIVRYFNGLGIRFSTEGWGGPRHWLQRAWTLQEITAENKTINGGIPRDQSGDQSDDQSDQREVFLNSQGELSGKLMKFRSAIRPVIQLAAQVDSPHGCEIYELAREMAKRHSTEELDKLSGLFYLLGTTQLPCYDEKLTSEDIWRQCFHLLPPERKVEVLFDFPYRGSGEQWFPTWAQVLDWPTRDSEYDHKRSQSSRDLVRYIPGETSFVLTNIWTIPDVILHETNYPGEYRATINKGRFGFYLPYLSQKPIDMQGQSVCTLATMDPGHAYNWVICKAIKKQAGRDLGLAGVAHVNVLKKVGIMRTDSCSELLVGGEGGTSLLQKMNCLFV